MTDVVIETGIPMPPRRNGPPPSMIAPRLRELLAAEIGASVFFAGKTKNQVSPHASNIGGGKLATRAVEGGIRVWRIA